MNGGDEKGGAVRELVVNKAQAGVFTKPGDANDFKEKIFYLRNHSQELNRMGKSGYNFVKENFDRQKLAKKYLEILSNFFKYE